MRRTTKREEAVALVVTLCLLVLATILVTGFLVSARTERQAAQSMANSQLTDCLAQDALEHATAILDNNIPQPVPPGQTPTPQNWIVSPGLLTKVTQADGSTPTYIPLSTNPDYLNPPTTNYVNLNAAIPGPSPAQYYILPTNDELRATWVNVLQNPLAKASATNPIVGRYAFWMDDENAKINVNTAYGKPANMNLLRANPLDILPVGNGYDDVGFNATRSPSATPGLWNDFYAGDKVDPADGRGANVIGTPHIQTTGTADLSGRLFPLWHPSAINLDLLGTDLNRVAMADWIFHATYNGNSGQDYLINGGTSGGVYRPLSYPEQIMQFVASTSPNLFSANKFNLTAYNRAPEFNAFGKPRLLMETTIRTQVTASPRTNDWMSTSYVSGAEKEFYQTPDLDPYGPMYFHGDENVMIGAYGQDYADANSVQMVADYISTLLSRNDWPGMPARSFVDKWGGGDPGRREADQVAWNIVSMGNYSSDFEGSTNTHDWPEEGQLTFMRTTEAGGPDKAGNYGQTYSKVTTQAPSKDGYSNFGYQDPNRCLRVGKLSGKAIMPFNCKPPINEVTLQVTAAPKNPAAPDGTFTLQLMLRVELYAGKRFPPGSYWSHFNTAFTPTHFFYTIADTSNHVATQGADGYLPGAGDGGASDGYISPSGADFSFNAGGSGGTPNKAPYVDLLGGACPASEATATTPTAVDPPVVIPADGYNMLQSTSGIYAATGNPMLTSPTTVVKGQTVTNPAVVAYAGIVHVQAKLRLCIFANDINRVWEIVPIWDNVDSSLPALKPPAGQSDSIAWDFYLDLTSIPTGSSTTFTRSLEAVDPRLGCQTMGATGPIWVPHPLTVNPTVQDANSEGAENEAAIAKGLDLDNYAYMDFHNSFYKNNPRPSIGFLSCIPTGMQRGIVNSTMQFIPSASKNDLPDWLLLDLLAPSFLDITQPNPAPLSYLHSSMGKINLNAQIYPGKTITRNLPMQALFKNMVSNGQYSQLATNVIQHNLAGLDYGAQGQYDYIGELCEVAGVADDNTKPMWQREMLIRNLANLLTTNSNTFKVYGLAQAVTVQKKAGNTDYSSVEAGDTVTVNGEKRFESTIERSVWPGVDGVPGNAHVSSTGAYDQISKQTSPQPWSVPWAAVEIPSSTPAVGSTWAQFDGPDDPRPMHTNAGYPPAPGWFGLVYNQSTLKSALNPARAHMTYKPINFRYVTN